MTIEDVEMAEAISKQQPLVTAETPEILELSNRNCESPSEWQQVADGMSFGSADSFQFSDDDITLPEIEEEQIISKPLDLALLKEIIQAGTLTLEKISGQDVCLVLGKTGSGKSTLIQGIAGKEYQSERYSIQGESFEKLVYEAQDALEGFEIGHDKVSQTTTINCFERKRDTGEPLFYVDSPGWEDTNGHEVDIATCVMIRQVAKRAKSLRFIIVINYTSLMESRGEALRSILKIVHSFVADFEESKKSFCFLFTHTDSFLPTDVRSANQQLKGEIVHTDQGTQDESIKSVLKFIKQCLEKNFPFVQIFHPLRTDMNKLRKFVETKLQVVLNPVTTGSMTMAAQFRLRSQLQSMRLNLKHLLTQTSVNTVKIKEIQETFACLDEYIGSGDIRTAVEECKEAIERFCLQETLEVDELIALGTNLDSTFAVEDITKLRHAMQHLIALKDFSLDHFATRLTNRLREFQQTILSGDTSFHDVSKKLDKLQVWANAFDFKDIYEETLSYYNQILDVYESTFTEFFSMKLDDALEEDIKLLVDAFCVMDVLTRNSLEGHALNVEKSFESFEKMKNHIGITLVGWQKELERLATAANKNSIEEIGQLASRANVLVLLTTHLSNGYVCLDLKDKAALLLKDIRCHVVEIYEVTASENWVTMPLTSDLFQRVERLKTGAASFQGLAWNEVELSCTRVLGKVHSNLSGQARNVSLQSDNARKQGITCGKAMAYALLRLDQCMCYDELFVLGDRFVQNVSIKAHTDYEKRIKKIEKQVDDIFNKLFDPTKDSLEALEELKQFFPEVKQIALFGSVLEDKKFEAVEANINTKLLDYLGKMSRRAESSVKQWNVAVEGTPNLDRLQKETSKLDGLVREMKVVWELGASDSILEEVHKVVSHVSAAFSAFTDKVDSELTASRKFQHIAHRFACIEILNDFSAIKHLLPSLEVCKSRAVDIVSETAQGIEKLVEETAEWDKIDDMMANLEKATALDKYTGGQASYRLGPLRKLRDQKEVQVDSVLAKLIEGEDFKSIGDLLAPLAESKDHLKRRKFHSYGKEIQRCLQLHIDKITQILLSTNLNHKLVSDIVKGLSTIEDAETQIGPHLKASIDLNVAIKQLKVSIDNKLNKYCSNFDDAFKAQDFSRMAVSKWRASLFVKHLALKAPYGAKEKVHKIEEQYKQSIQAIQEKVEIFLLQGFSNGQDLLKVLSSLKEGSDNTQNATTELTKLYASTKKDFEEKLILTLYDLERNVNDKECFEDGVDLLRKLVIVLEGGLRKHVDSTLFPFDCNERLRLWTKNVEDEGNTLSFEGPEIDNNLKNLSRKLDIQCSPTLVQSFVARITSIVTFTPTMSYESLCEKVSGKVRQIDSEAISSLRKSDFESAHNHMSVLHLMDINLAKHIPLVRKALSAVKATSITIFKEILENGINVLKKHDLVSFEAVFLEIRRFVLNVDCAFEDMEVKARFRLLNQLVASIFVGQVTKVKNMLEFQDDSFDFGSIRSAVEDARRFGGFIADYFTLFHEEGKTINNFPEDESLKKIVSICHDNYGDERDFTKIKFFAILGISPSSGEKDIRQACKRKIATCNTETMGGGNMAAIRFIKEAEVELLRATSCRQKENIYKPFDRLLRGVNEKIRKKVKAYLIETRYDFVDVLLLSLPGLRDLKDLVHPELDVDLILNEVDELIKNHVNKAKIEVETLWAERKYRDLNDVISDLRSMEQNFKTHSRVFSKSWNDGILKQVEDEITTLGKECRELLSSKTLAKENESEFRRKFLQMGCVLVELQSLTSFTKGVIAEVLEYCLGSEWGFGYLFELGLSLQRGDDDDDNTAHIAHFILAEFSHFKEVLTMTWNTETCQKPAEDSVEQILVQSIGVVTTRSDIQQDVLLDCFRVFEAQYNALLGEYIRPEANKNHLASKVKRRCLEFKTVCCSGGWNEDLRSAIPEILGGVFALFTICKSGESFNRIEASGDSANFSEQVLLKPHNIQVLTILYMFGCGSEESNNDLDSQLLQIRTGEGKSMILGAAATVFGLLGFHVRCACYSEYLSNRDYALFHEVFECFGLREYIKYDKITSLSENTIASKGDIRSLTGALLRGKLSKKLSHEQIDSTCSGSNEGRITSRSPDDAAPKRELSSTYIRSLESSGGAGEILLVDEVDVFFGSDFYGQTYNQVAQLREPEIEEILKFVWKAHKNGGRRLRLGDVQKMQAYSSLVSKIASFKFVVDNEISLMLDDVRRVDEIPYFLDPNDRIGYKVMDTISYDVTLGYQTTFAYLKESDAGNLKENDLTLAKVLCINVSCGQFSYANIHPTRILGVSGTLDAMSAYEKKVLENYGIKRFIFMPTVYGASNFQFDKAGDGICIESGQSDFFHKICSAISEMTKKGGAVIVFFSDSNRLNAFEASSFYRKLGRKKAKLSEDMDAATKDFVIKKASTSGQLTICSAVFGRGTDFFCKDQKVQDNGGVHIIQTFLSAEKSEEIQIQGRTARQGKKGTYQLILLDSDLETDFDIPQAFKDQTPKKDWYQELSRARDEKYSQRCAEMDSNLARATSRDRNAHDYFDALLCGNRDLASSHFKDIYYSMKNRTMPSSLKIDLGIVIDVTGSMSPYMQAATETINCLLGGSSSIINRLKVSFPEIEFILRVGTLAFRDFEDSSDQFMESTFSKECHFTQNMSDLMHVIEDFTETPFGGDDLAEDLFGAVHKCAMWDQADDWNATVKFIMAMTDAPAHGLVPLCSREVVNADNFPDAHPTGLTSAKVVDILVQKGIDLFFCSFNPDATGDTEESLSKLFLDHPSNTSDHELTSIPMVPKGVNPVGTPILSRGQCQHIIFVLDESGSMEFEWGGVVVAYQHFIAYRIQNQCSGDLVSVVQFQSDSRVTVCQQWISDAPTHLGYSGGGTYYTPAAEDAHHLVLQTPRSHTPVVIFMSDGLADEGDAIYTADLFKETSGEVRNRTGSDLDLHVIAFGSGMDTRQLVNIMHSSNRGRIHSSANSAQLSRIFIEIAKATSDVASVLEAEIGRRITEVVSDKVALEYLGS